MPAIAAIAARQINVVSAIVSIYSLLLHSMAKVRFFFEFAKRFLEFFLTGKQPLGQPRGRRKEERTEIVTTEWTEIIIIILISVFFVCDATRMAVGLYERTEIK